MEIRHASSDDPCATEIEVFTYHTFELLLQQNQVNADVRTTGGGRPVLEGAAASRDVASVLV
jgi:hypothetical protein